jgi:hypothetical protein
MPVTIIYGSADGVTMSAFELSDFIYVAAVSAVYLIGLLIYNMYKPKKKTE